MLRPYKSGVFIQDLVLDRLADPLEPSHEATPPSRAQPPRL